MFLDDDSLSVVFSKLSRADYARASKVSRQWHQVGDEPYYWRQQLLELGIKEALLNHKLFYKNNAYKNIYKNLTQQTTRLQIKDIKYESQLILLIGDFALVREYLLDNDLRFVRDDHIIAAVCVSQDVAYNLAALKMIYQERFYTKGILQKILLETFFDGNLAFARLLVLLIRTDYPEIDLKNIKTYRGTSLLDAAAGSGNEKIFDYALELQLPYKSDKSDLVYFAVIGGNKRIIARAETLSNFPLDRFKSNFSLIHALILSPGVALFQEYLDKYFAIGIVDADGKNILHHAFYNNRMDIVDVALAKGLNPKSVCMRGRSILHYAIKGGAETAVRRAEALSGIKLAKIARDSGSTCFSAMNSCSPEVVQLCLDAGFDPNKKEGSKGWTPLLSSQAHESGVIAAKLLIERGADPYAKLDSGATLLHWAAYSGYPENVMHALQYIPVDSVDKRNQSALFFCRSYDQVVAVLVEHGADVNRFNNNGTTPLMQMVVDNNYGGCEILVRHPNINLFATDKDGLNALDYALVQKILNQDIIKLLEDAGFGPKLEHTLRN